MRGHSILSAPAFASRYAGLCRTERTLVEQVLDIRPDALEIVLCGSRQVRTTLNSVCFNPQAVVAEPCGEHTGAPLVQV